MKHFLLTVLGVIVGLALSVVIGLFFVTAMLTKSEPVPQSQVLLLDLSGGLTDQPLAANPLSTPGPSVVNTVRVLKHAEDNPRVKGLLIRATPALTPAKAEELRTAIRAFKESGKFVYAFAQGFESPSMTGYMAVASADEIWTQASTDFAVAGMRSEVQFLGGVMDNFDIKVEMEQFHEYKNAANQYKETGFTEPHREALSAWLGSIAEIGKGHIAEDRGLSMTAITEAMDAAPISAEVAKSLGLIDTLGYWEDIKIKAKDAGGKGTKFVSVSGYNLPYIDGPVIALISGEGPIMPGSSSSGGFGQDQTIGGDTVAKAIYDATKSKSVEAIVLRVSSPGGSPAASDQIDYAVQQARKAGKPVIVSMGSYAASGGYYVSMHADKIVALPTTITGSIGVFGGKIVLDDALGKYGFNVDSVAIGGPYLGSNSSMESYNQRNRAAYRESLSRIYADFTEGVADGRGLPLTDVQDLAKGRVWTGAQAKELGLVDELGGLNKAITLAKAAANIDADTAVRIRNFPRQKTTQEQIMDLMSGIASAEQLNTDIQTLLKSPEVQALLRARAALTYQSEGLYAPLPRID